MKTKNHLMDIERAVEVFGDFRHKFVITSDNEECNIGDEVTLINQDCKMSFDNLNATFKNNILYYYIVDLEFVSADYRGKYKYGKFKVLWIHEKTY